jgi:hypothetical protein
MVTTGGVVSFTVIVKVALDMLLCVSVAVQLTVVVPSGNVAPEAGLHETVATSSGSVAVTA